MVWPFSKKTPESESKLEKIFFEMICKFGVTDIVPGRGIISMVLDNRNVLGTDSPIEVMADGVQEASLLVASEDGGFIVVSKTPTGKGDRLKPDDIVIWVPHERASVGDDHPLDSRSAWLGLIMAKVNPRIDPNNPNEFDIACKYHD